MAFVDKHIVVDSGGTEADVTAANALKTDGSAVTQPVSATNLDIRDLTFAADKVDASGTVLGTGTNNIGDVDILSLPNEGQQTMANSISVAIASDQSALPVTGGGGVQYTEGDTDATITGTAILHEIGADVLATVSSSNPLPVDYVSMQIGGGIENGSLRVTIANDSTGVLSVDDNGSSLTVDGTITANAGTNLNTSLLALEAGGNLAGAATSLAIIDDWDETDRAKVNPIAGQAGVQGASGVVSANTQRVVLATDVALPAGDLAIGRVKLTDGTDVADVLDLTNSNPLTVAIVDANGDQVVSFGGGTQYTEDAPAAANPVGTASILVRQDTPATLVDTDGDNVAQRGTNYGAAFVQVVDSAGAFIDTFGGGTQYTEGDTDASITGTAMLMEGAADTLLPVQGTVADGLLVNLGTNNDVTVTGVSTLAEQQTQTGHLATIAGDTTDIEAAVELIDDTVATLGTTTYTETSTKGLIIGAVRRDADTTLVDTTNEVSPLQVDANGRLKVEIFDGGESHTVDGTVAFSNTTIAVTNAGTFVTQENGSALTALQLLDDVVVVLGTDTYTEATSKGQIVGAVRRDADTPLAGTTNEYSPLITDANGYLKVEVFDGGGTHTVDAPLGTPVNVQIGNATLAAGVIDETGASAVDALAVGGGTAHDAVDSGNPVKVGGVAVSGSATPTSVASGDRTRFIANQHGIPYGIGGHPNLITREYDFGTAAQTDVNLAAAVVAADERIYVTRFEALCDNANTVAVSVRAGFGTASVPTASATGVSGMIASHPGLAAGSGIICGNGAGILAVGAAGEEPRLTSSAATTGNLHVIISYFLIDETP